MKFLDILLVEDDEDLLIFLHNSLIRAGYNVVSVKDAESALQELEQSKFRILITDIKLPPAQTYLPKTSPSKYCQH